MKQLAILLLILSCSSAFSQKRSKIDSLNTILLSAKIDTDMVKIMNSIANTYSKSDMDSGVHYAEAAYKLAKRLNFNRGLLLVYGTYGNALINVGKYEEALKLSEEGRLFMDKLLRETTDTIERNKILKRMASVTSNLGASYDYMAKYPEALNYYMEAVRQYESVGDRKGSASVYHNVGGVYLSIEDYDKALIHFRKAYDINKETGNKRWLANNVGNIAIVYSMMKKVDSALAANKQALLLYDEIGDALGMTNATLNIGVMYTEAGYNDSAILYIAKTLELNEGVGEPKISANGYLSLSTVYLNKKDNAQARKMLKKAESIVLSLRDFELLEIYYMNLFKVDSSQGNPLGAIRYLQLAYRYRDSVHNEENVRKLTQTQMTYDFERKVSETRAAQEKKDALAAKEMHRQKTMRNASIGGFVVVLLFAIVFFSQRNKIKLGKKQSDELLLNILPAEVAEELKAKGSADAKLIDDVTVLFTDFKGFTQLSEKLSPKELVAEINTCFSAFDNIMQKHGVEKIKTIGDAYMAAGGLPTPNKTHAEDVVKAALEIQDFMHRHKTEREAAGKLFFEIRIGVHTGPVVAGIVGIKKFAYDIWGDTVNTASRMESSGSVGMVNISETTYNLVKDKFTCEYRGEVEAKGKGVMKMYFVG
ncbi:MAG: tetratricopeptide repeat protein [Taibaiella sp.]|nr:tetratricopeptide repeat protein [Taibaiella sp.]